VKKIGGAKNGGERIVRLQKNKSNYASKAAVRSRGPKKFFKDHARNTRKNLVPGRVVILLAGRHKGKRVIVMKALATGLLLVNGPYYLNRCPLRRVSQRYVIATKTRVNIKKVKLPEHLNDSYFKRPSKKGKNKNAEGDIFAKKEEKYLPTEQRKQDQKVVDKQVKEALKTHRLYNVLKKYLKEPFGLKTNQYPHRMRF
jgi:large subunit ribosomal protein L6e